MLLREVEYARPSTVAEALELLAGDDGARPLAGGQTLINVMKLRVISPGRVVDIMRIPELRGVRIGPLGSLEIGATTTYAELSEATQVWAGRPLIAEVASVIADVQVRNRGTIGGNACLNLPTNHFPSVLVAIGAELRIEGPAGQRTVAAEDFFVSPFTTAVAQGELLTHVIVPQRRPEQCEAFVAMSVGKESQSLMHVAVSMRLDGVIEEARVVLGCVGPRPLRAEQVERALAGSRPDDPTVRAAVEGLGSRFSPISDVNATAAFKRHVAEVIVRRAVLRAVERAEAQFAR